MNRQADGKERMIMGPTDAVIAVTYACNSKCMMCNIWKNGTKGELPPSSFSNLPSSLRTINVSGGEPFLQEDLVEVIGHIKKACPRARMVISTNGLLPDRIEKTLKNILKIDPTIGVGVSIDGIGAMDDEVRGVANAYERAVETLERMKTIGMRDLRIAFTASQKNLEHMRHVYDLANDLGVEFTFAVAQNSKHYFKTDDNQEINCDALKDQLDYVIRKELQASHAKSWFRAYYAFGAYTFSCMSERLLPCRAGRAFFFMGPQGDIYPCNVLDSVIGNIRDARFSEIWRSQRGNSVREAVSKCGNGCWMICTARSAIKENTVAVSLWILNHKLRAHMGAKIL
jgi:radical SAM protein with 4Fe4S-binding SPASM domain